MVDGLVQGAQGRKRILRSMAFPDRDKNRRAARPKYDIRKPILPLLSFWVELLMSEDNRPGQVTRELVFDAAYALLRQGERPTVNRIRDWIGSGSPSTINSALNSWWAELSKRLQHAHSARPGMPKAAYEAATRLWDAALEDAHNALAKHRENADRQVLEARERAKEATAATRQAQASTEALEDNLARATGRIHAVERELAAETVRREEAENKILSREAQLGQLQAAMERQRQEHQLALQQERKEHQQVLVQEKKTHQQALDTERARYDALERHLLSRIEEHRRERERAERTQEELQAEVREFQQKLQNALVDLSRARAEISRVSAYTRDIQDRLDEVTESRKNLERDSTGFSAL